MKSLIKTFVLLLLVLASYASNASHFNGGDVEYECTGPRTWRIRLTIYRDCSGATLCGSMSCTQSMTARPSTTLNPAGCVANPSTAPITLNLVKVEDVGKANVALCGPIAKNMCTNLNQVTPGSYNPSIEKYVFEGILNLNYPSLNNTNCIYWDISWDLCCRNANIWNLANSASQDFRIGATINIMNRSQSPCKNNSPILKNEPVLALCSGAEYILNMGAIDPDGDSLSYEIAPALQSGGNPVNYQSPGSANYPFPLNSNRAPHTNFPQPNGPYVIMDSATGDFSFNAVNNTPGYFLGNLNIRVKQWAYDTLGNPFIIGITHRDLQYYLFNCPSNNPPSFKTIPSLANNKPKYNYDVIAGQQLCFTVVAKDTDVYPSISRYDSTRISWNQGIIRPGKLTFQPNYTIGPNQPRPREDSWQFCWQTEATDVRSLPYYFTVTAVDNFCPNIGTAIKAFSIKINPQPPVARHILRKTNNTCGVVNYKVYKDTPFVWLNNASLQIAAQANDRNLTSGLRNITPININPTAGQNDTINQPRLMFTDTFGYSLPGTYFVRFTYTTPYQTGVIQIMDSIVINPDSIALANIFTQFDTSFCKGDSSLIMANNTNPRYKYQWQKNGVDIPNGNAESIYAKQSGAYRLLVTDTVINCNNFSNTLSFNIYPEVLLKPSIISGCVFTSIVVNYYDSSTINNGSFTRTWHFGDGTSSMNLSGKKTYTNAGNFPIKLVVTTNFGCKDSVINNVTINQPAEVTIIANGNTTFCEGSSLNLTGNTYPNANYYWYKNNQLISGNGASKIVNDQGNYKLIVDLGNNCKDTSNNISVTVNPTPKVGFTVNNSSQCENNNLFVITDTTTISSGTFNRTWSWDNNTSSLPILNTPFTAAGVKSIKLKAVSNNGCSDSVTKNVTVLSKPNIGFMAGPTTNLSNQQAYDYNLNQQLNHTYNWSLTNGNIINGQGTNAVRVQWLTPGTGKLNAVISNNNGCSDSTSLNVSILGNNQVPTITSFTPQTGSNGTVITINGSNLSNSSAVLFGGVNAKNFNVVSASVISATVDTGATGNVSVVTPNGTALLTGFTYINNTGVAEYVTQSYTIFPNPVSSEIIIESDKTLNNASFELMDVNGKVLITTTCNNATNRFNIDVKTLSPAVYFLRITSQGQTSTVKVVKQ